MIVRRAAKCEKLPAYWRKLLVTLTIELEHAAVGEETGLHLPLDRLLFWNETVGVTGGSPYEEHAISKIVRLEGGIVGDKDIWQTHQIVVVGREAFDEDYLIESREFGIEHGFTCRYLS